MPAIPPHCPLCPNLFCSHYPLSDVASLAAHFKFCHGLRNSSFILAKNMCFSPFAYYEVLQVLKDFRDLNDQLSNTRNFLHYKLTKENMDRRNSFSIDQEVTEAVGGVKIKRNQEVYTEDRFLHLVEEKVCLEVEEMVPEPPLPKSKACMMTHPIEVDKLSIDVNAAHKKVNVFLKKKEVEISRLVRRKNLLIETNNLMIMKNEETNSSEEKLQLGRYRLVQTLMKSLA